MFHVILIYGITVRQMSQPGAYVIFHHSPKFTYFILNRFLDDIYGNEIMSDVIQNFCWCLYFGGRKVVIFN